MIEHKDDNTRSFVPISMGTMVSHYRIIEKIGAGGMGEVYLGEDTKYVGGYEVPLGDLRVVAPAAVAVLAIILLLRTRGAYTKWLAVIIFLAAFVIVYSLDAGYFGRLLRIGVEEAAYEIR